MAEALMQTGDYAAARSIFDEYVLEMKGDPQITVVRSKFRLGEASYLLGDNQRSKRDLQAFVQLHEDDALAVPAFKYLAEIAAAEKDYAEAERLYQQALSRTDEEEAREACQTGLRAIRALMTQADQGRPHSLESTTASTTTGSAADSARARDTHPAGIHRAWQLERLLRNRVLADDAQRGEAVLECVRIYCQCDQEHHARRLADSYPASTRLSTEREIRWRLTLAQLYASHNAHELSELEHRRVSVLSHATGQTPPSDL
jgi:tetratricopeptide (TPR) repeat protein